MQFAVRAIGQSVIGTGSTDPIGSQLPRHDTLYSDLAHQESVPLIIGTHHSCFLDIASSHLAPHATRSMPTKDATPVGRLRRHNCAHHSHPYFVTLHSSQQLAIFASCSTGSFISAHVMALLHHSPFSHFPNGHNACFKGFPMLPQSIVFKIARSTHSIIYNLSTDVFAHSIMFVPLYDGHSELCHTTMLNEQTSSNWPSKFFLLQERVQGCSRAS